MTDRTDPPRLSKAQLRQVLEANQKLQCPDCFVCGQPVHEQTHGLGTGYFEERTLTNAPCGHRMTYNVNVAAQAKAELEDERDAEDDQSPWCCNGNAEDCALCTDPNPPYPFLCPGHPVTAANQRIIGEATAATEATDPCTCPKADALCAELYRRASHLQTLTPNTSQWEHVYGETLGLRGAIGIVLGHQVTGSADEAGAAYYRAWLERTGGQA